VKKAAHNVFLQVKFDLKMNLDVGRCAYLLAGDL